MCTELSGNRWIFGWLWETGGNCGSPHVGWNWAWTDFDGSFPPFPAGRRWKMLEFGGIFFFFRVPDKCIRFSEISSVFRVSHCRNWFNVFRFRPYFDGIRMVPAMILVGHSGFPFYIHLISVSFPVFPGHWNRPELYGFVRWILCRNTASFSVDFSGEVWREVWRNRSELAG